MTSGSIAASAFRLVDDGQVGGDGVGGVAAGKGVRAPTALTPPVPGGVVPAVLAVGPQGGVGVLVLDEEDAVGLGRRSAMSSSGVGRARWTRGGGGGPVNGDRGAGRAGVVRATDGGPASANRPV